MDLEKYGITMWSEEKIKAFRKALLDWYDKNKRDLPWRKNTDPYAVWVSEIMLQQTRVDTVIPYFYRFMEQLPTIQALAEASEEVLLKVWEGLGYYTRVRNMQQAARQIMEEYHGVFPTTYETIIQLKGIGPYTAGAIASISFGLPEPAVDGNLMRVLSRLFEIDYDIGNPSNRKIFQAVAEVLIDPKRPGDFNQALMDLGSDIESPVNPKPELSPVKDFSAAYLNGTMARYPIKKPKKKPMLRHFRAFVIQNEKGEYLLEKNTTNLLQGFWSFPLIEDFSRMYEQPDLFMVAESSEEYVVPNMSIPLTTQFESLYRQQVEWQAVLSGTVQHIFSHQKWSITLQTGRVQHEQLVIDKELAWVNPTDFIQYPFAKPQHKMIALVLRGRE